MSELANPEFQSQLYAFFTRHYMMVGGFFVVLVWLIVVQFKLTTARISKMSTTLAINAVNKEDGVFVDIRAQDLFQKGHIANAVSLTLNEIKSNKIQQIDKKRDCPVIIVGKDKFDTDAFNAARMLKKQGFSKVSLLDGGLLDWASNNLPLTTK